MLDELLHPEDEGEWLRWWELYPPVADSNAACGRMGGWFCSRPAGHEGNVHLFVPSYTRPGLRGFRWFHKEKK